MKNAKKPLLAILLLLAIVGADVGIVKVSYSPNPAKKGDIVQMNIYLRNFNPDDDAKDVEVTVEGSPRVIPIQNRFEVIEPYGTVVATFYIKIPKNLSTTTLHYVVRVRRSLSIDQTLPIALEVEHPSTVAVNIEPVKGIRAGECTAAVVRIDVHGESISDVLLQLVNSYPVYNSTSIYLPHVENSTTITLPFCIDKDVPSGRYQLIALAQWHRKGQVQGATATNELYVISEPNLVISEVKTEPRQLRSEHRGEVGLTIENIGPEPIYALKVIPNAKWCVQNQSYRSEGLLYPLYRGMAGKVHIICDKITRYGNLTLCVELKGKDKYGNNITVHKCLPLRVKPAPKLKISSYTVRNPYTSEEATVILNISNIGDETAYHIDITPDVEWPFTTDAKRDYVHKLPPHTSAVVRLPIDIYPNAKEKGYGLKVILNYEDADGNKFSETSTIPVNVKIKDLSGFMETWVKTHPVFSLMLGLALALIAVLTWKAGQVG